MNAIHTRGRPCHRTRGDDAVNRIFQELDEIESEDELQEWLKSYFEDRGWTAIREVSPDWSNDSANLLVRHADYGWFGIEMKYFSPDDGGRKLANAHRQILFQYRGRNYLNNRITLWVLCPYIDDTARRVSSHLQFIREFLCGHGIGYIDLRRNDLLIDFAYSHPEAKVPVGGPSISKYQDSVAMPYIYDKVENHIAQLEGSQ